MQAPGPGPGVALCSPCWEVNQRSCMRCTLGVPGKPLNSGGVLTSCLGPKVAGP